MAKTVIICMDGTEYFKQYLYTGEIQTTDNQLEAATFYDTSIAADVCKKIEKMGHKCLIRDLQITNPQELLEYIRNQIWSACDNMGADVSINYNKHYIAVCMPDGMRTYKLTLTTEFITE